jgi:hypothetical protein
VPRPPVGPVPRRRPPVELGPAREGLTREDCSLGGEPGGLRNAAPRAESSGIGGDCSGRRGVPACPDVIELVTTTVALQGSRRYFDQLRRTAALLGSRPPGAPARRTEDGLLARCRPRTAIARLAKAATIAQLTGNKRRTCRHPAYYSRANIVVMSSDVSTYRRSETRLGIQGVPYVFSTTRNVNAMLEIRV